MTESKCFFDTNLLVYLYSNDPKSAIVEKLIYAHFGQIWLSIQVLNELYSVLTRKTLKTKEKAQIIISDLIESYKTYCIDEQYIKRAIALHIQYHFSYWDSLIIAAALEVGCTKLYSEYLQHDRRSPDYSESFSDEQINSANGVNHASTAFNHIVNHKET